MMGKKPQTLPLIICGPMVRRLTPDRIVLWWVSPKKIYPEFECGYADSGSPIFSLTLSEKTVAIYQVGQHAFVHLADIRPPKDLPCDIRISYDLRVSEAELSYGLADLMPHIVYAPEARPCFVVRKHIRRFFHGSCRKPHHDSDDAMVGLDKDIKNHIDNMNERPALLMLTGDQIYSDDVAGPMLQAIHTVIDLLGLNNEVFDRAPVFDAQLLYRHHHSYYYRKKIIPRTKVGESWYRRGGAKHIFSSRLADNHLITFAEWMAMYLLVWSPVLWPYVIFDSSKIPEKYRQRFEEEQQYIEDFSDDLPKVQRIFAHIPTYMIFDDHDITDDWNLTARWEQQAYDHPFSKRIIGNALMAYFLCQGLGNAPEKFKGVVQDAAVQYVENPGKSEHDHFIETLLAFKHWHFEVPVFPELVVMDSRTRRWKRRRRKSSPSGLLDWEALMKLQNKLMRSDAVLLVAPAPIFGVKLVELIQRIFTAFGYSLAVDAENWMAHRRSAFTLLEIFKNAKTASYNVIISGDVHYSFAYDIDLRFTKNCPGIWQITSSGIKNEFPKPLLYWIDRFNQILYSPWSPLNWFTKRRDLIVFERLPENYEQRRLVADNGIGCVTLDEKGAPVEISEIYADGRKLKFVEQVEEEKRNIQA